MFYREAGDFKTSYAEDNQTFPIAFDRYRYYYRFDHRASPSCRS
jgi:branched-chain amino acid transport system permease protein